MKTVASRKTTTVHGLVPLFAIALLAQATPAGGQKFPSRAEEMKAKQEQADQQEAKKAQAKQEEIARQEREKAGAPTKIGGSVKPVASDAEARAIAEKAAHFEKVYRERAARIDRLTSIYKKKGDQAKVDELQTMRDKLDDRHENAMQGFRKQLGEDRWARTEKHWGGPSARALQVRNERANENAAERDARKAQKEAEGKTEKPESPPRKKADEERPKEKPPGQSGKDR